MIKTAKLRLGKAGKIDHFNCQTLDVKDRDVCIVQNERGLDYAVALSDAQIVQGPCEVNRLCKVLRVAGPEDHKQLKDNQQQAEQVFVHCKEHIRKSKLPLKLVDVEYSFDRQKLVVYFSAEGRVDFRKLVRELAAQFKLRIEMRQIGVRDEAKLLGGQGRCGRTLCCTSHLKDFTSVSIEMVKTQRLPATPSKVSGVCGRLMCCLAYEYDAYQQLGKTMPDCGSIVLLKEHGRALVVDMNILKQSLFVELSDNGRRLTVPINMVQKVLKNPRAKHKEAQLQESYNV